VDADDFQIGWGGFEGDEAVNAVKMWLRRLEDWVGQKVDQINYLVPGKSSNIFASGWAAFTELTIVQFQDIEQVPKYDCSTSPALFFIARNGTVMLCSSGYVPL
jgi:hypothetical protein